MEKKDRLKLANWWPPFLGAGIKLTQIADDMRFMEILRPAQNALVEQELRRHALQRLDVFDDRAVLHAGMLLENLGKDYIVCGQEDDHRSFTKNPPKAP